MIKISIVLVVIASGIFASGELPTLELNEALTVDSQRIIKGENANEGEFPFMASIRLWSNNSKPIPPFADHRCGASVITPHWVLSAAHCCTSYIFVSKYYLYAGSIYLSTGGSKHQLQKVIIHEKYNASDKWRNDICLMRVSQPFIFNNELQQAALPMPGDPVNSGDKVTIAGWGYIDPETKLVPDRLQKGVNYIALSQAECASVTKFAELSSIEYLCARGAAVGQNAWNGDSGGPLLRQGILTGITSFGFRPYGISLPDVYTRVSNYIDWIKEKLDSEASLLIFKK